MSCDFSFGDPFFSGIEDPFFCTSFKDSFLCGTSFFEDPFLRGTPGGGTSFEDSFLRGTPAGGTSFEDFLCDTPGGGTSFFEDPFLRGILFEDPFLRGTSFEDPFLCGISFEVLFLFTCSSLLIGTLHIKEPLLKHSTLSFLQNCSLTLSFCRIVHFLLLIVFSLFSILICVLQM